MPRPILMQSHRPVAAVAVLGALALFTPLARHSAPSPQDSVGLSIDVSNVPALAQPHLDEVAIVVIDPTLDVLAAPGGFDQKAVERDAALLTRIGDLLDLPVIVVGAEGGKLGEVEGAKVRRVELGAPSALRDGGLERVLDRGNNDEVVLVGVLGHPTTELTALDLLRSGTRLFIATDFGAESISPRWQSVLSRLESAGAVPVGVGTFAYDFEAVDSVDDSVVERLIELSRRQ